MIIEKIMLIDKLTHFYHILNVRCLFFLSNDSLNSGFEVWNLQIQVFLERFEFQNFWN